MWKLLCQSEWLPQRIFEIFFFHSEFVGNIIDSTYSMNMGMHKGELRLLFCDFTNVYYRTIVALVVIKAIQYNFKKILCESHNLSVNVSCPRRHGPTGHPHAYSKFRIVIVHVQRYSHVGTTVCVGTLNTCWYVMAMF